MIMQLVLYFKRDYINDDNPDVDIIYDNRANFLADLKSHFWICFWDPAAGAILYLSCAKLPKTYEFLLLM